MNGMLKLSASTFLAIQLLGCAGSPPARDASPKRADPMAQPAAEPCTPTGSHIQRRGDCQVNGQTITREELDRTGRPTLGEALRASTPRLR